MMNYEVINASVDDIFSIQANIACNNGCVATRCTDPAPVAWGCPIPGNP